MKCCGVELKAHCPVARFRHRKRFSKCRRYGVETGGREKVHANSPLKRQEWLKECWRKQKNNQKDAKMGKVSETRKPEILKKSEVTEKPENPQKSEITEKPEIP